MSFDPTLAIFDPTARALYDPSQPRTPSGSPHGGEFAATGAVYVADDTIPAYPGRAPSDHVSRVQDVPLDQIEPSERTLDEPTVRAIMQAIRQGEALPAIVVEFSHDLPDARDGVTVIDGHHRLEAAKRLGLTHIPALVVVQAEDWPHVKQAGGLTIDGAIRYRANKYDPAQPRVPAGTPGTGGRWTDGDAGVSGGTPDAERRRFDPDPYNTPGADGEPAPAYSAVVARLRAVIRRPKGALGDPVSVVPTSRNAIRAAEITADVLEEMQAKGYAMPTRVMVGHDAEPRGQVTQFPGRPDQILRIFVPETLPPGVDLDHVVAVTFGETVRPPAANPDPLYAAYEKFAVHTMRDVIIHEMGHIQDAQRHPRFDPAQAKWSATDANIVDALGGARAVSRAQRRVSDYAQGEDAEFIAEAFTRLYRGETVADDSLKLYRMMGGPPIRTKSPGLVERLTGVGR